MIKKRLFVGFTLIEVLIIVAILALLGGAGVGYYRNVAVGATRESAAKIFISTLRSALSV